MTVATLDFEASSLGSSGYPIEVGLSTVTIDGLVSTWSVLIQSHPSWDVGSGWESKAERVHGISAAALTNGMRPAAVLAHLNMLLVAHGEVWCDGGDYDRFWFERLCKAAPLVKPTFALRDLSELDMSLDERTSLVELLSTSTPEHRAGADAERLCRALLEVRRRRL